MPTTTTNPTGGNRAAFAITTMVLVACGLYLSYKNYYQRKLIEFFRQSRRFIKVGLPNNYTYTYTYTSTNTNTNANTSNNNSSKKQNTTNLNGSNTIPSEKQQQQQAAPPKHRQPIVRFMSYNILADRYINDAQYEYLSSEKRDFAKHRLPRILAQIEAYLPDIICLQETQYSTFHKYFEPILSDLANYGNSKSDISLASSNSSSRMKTGSKVKLKYGACHATRDLYGLNTIGDDLHSLSTFYNRDKYTLLKQRCFRFNELITEWKKSTACRNNGSGGEDADGNNNNTNVDYSKLIGKSLMMMTNKKSKSKTKKKTEFEGNDFIRMLESLPDLMLVLYLSDNVTGRRFVVCNSHLFWNPNYPDIKVGQAWILNECLEKYLINNDSDDYKEYFLEEYPKVEEIPIVLGIDANSLPIKFIPDEFDPILTVNSQSQSQSQQETNIASSQLESKMNINDTKDNKDKNDNKDGDVEVKTGNERERDRKDSNKDKKDNGNLNSIPNAATMMDKCQNNNCLVSGVYQLMTTAYLENTHSHHPKQRLLNNISILKRKLNNLKKKEDKESNEMKVKEIEKQIDYLSNKQLIEGEMNKLNEYEHSRLWWKSVYATASDNEPLFTLKTNDFQGCIDYIFINDGFRILSYLEMPYQNGLNYHKPNLNCMMFGNSNNDEKNDDGDATNVLSMNQIEENNLIKKEKNVEIENSKKFAPCPNVDYPSDHLALVCDLELMPTRQQIEKTIPQLRKDTL